MRRATTYAARRRATVERLERKHPRPLKLRDGVLDRRDHETYREVHRGVLPGDRSGLIAWPYPAISPERRNLAELRQRAWRDCGTEIQERVERNRDVQSAQLVRSLTVSLNGHDRDVSGHGRKRGYFVDGGGAWGDWRATWRSADGPEPARWLDRLTRENGETRGGGRVRRWSHRRESMNFADLDADSDARAEWHDLDSSESADLLGSGGERSGHVTSSLYGGQHDQVWLRYQRLRNGYATLDEHREALGRRGRCLPFGMRVAKADAERIVVALVDAGANKTEIAVLFRCDRQTIRRIVDRRAAREPTDDPTVGLSPHEKAECWRKKCAGDVRRLNVALFPYEGKPRLAA